MNETNEMNETIDEKVDTHVDDIDNMTAEEVFNRAEKSKENETSDDNVESQDVVDSEKDEASAETSEEEAITMTRAEYDAAMAAARKKGESKGRREVKEQVEQTIAPAFSEIYDPATNKPMDPSHPLYEELKKDSDRRVALEYNQRVQNELLKEQKQLLEQQRKFDTASQKVKYELEKTFVEKPDLKQAILANQDQLNPNTQGMVYAMAKSSNGVEALANLMKTNLDEAIRISNLPYEDQMLEMRDVIKKHAQGKGKPKTSSKAPAPASSFGNEGSPSVEKRDVDKTMEDIEADFRRENRMIS